MPDAPSALEHCIRAWIGLLKNDSAMIAAAIEGGFSTQSTNYDFGSALHELEAGDYWSESPFCELQPAWTGCAQCLRGCLPKPYDGGFDMMQCLDSDCILQGRAAKITFEEFQTEFSKHNTYNQQIV